MCHAVVGNRCIDLSSYHSPSLFVYYSFDSPAPFCEVKYQKGLSSAISGWMTPGDWGRISLCASGTSVCIYDWEHVLVWHSGYTLCVFACFCFCSILNHSYGFSPHFMRKNTLNTITDGCVSSERWFKSNISKERVTVERAGGPNGCLSCHKSSPGCDKGKSISTVGHQVSVYYVMALSRAITINHFNWSAALQSMGFKWRLFNR